MDEMAGKINELEQSMTVLMDRAGIDEAQVQDELDKQQQNET